MAPTFVESDRGQSSRTSSPAKPRRRVVNGISHKRREPSHHGVLVVDGRPAAEAVERERAVAQRGEALRAALHMLIEAGAFVRDQDRGPGTLHVVVERELADHLHAVDLVTDVFNVHPRAPGLSFASTRSLAATPRGIVAAGQRIGRSEPPVLAGDACPLPTLCS